MFSIDFSILSGEEVLALAKTILKDASLEEWETNIWEFIVNWYDPHVTEITIFSSGSTSKPKAISHTKQAMLKSAAATCQALQIRPNSTALLCLPANKISGMMMLVRSIYGKFKLICLKPSLSIINKLEIEPNIDFSAFTPMQFNAVLQSTEFRNRVSQIHNIILGGEDVSPALLGVIRTLPNDVYLTFGMTETISHIALKRLSGNSPDLHFKALQGISLSVDNRNCLVINAPGLLKEGSLITNDIVHLVSTTEFDWLGRADNVVNSGGIKIYPEQVESILSPVLKIPFFIAGVPDAVYGQKLVLAVEVAHLIENDKKLIMNALKELNKHYQPKELVLIPQFVRTENGKLNRNESLKMINERIAIKAP